MTQESFVSIGWRLIPYWLNNWEQQWGAECSSMVFELPHFALELLVVLPCVQVRGGEAGRMGQVRRSSHTPAPSIRPQTVELAGGPHPPPTPPMPRSSAHG